MAWFNTPWPLSCAVAAYGGRVAARLYDLLFSKTHGAYSLYNYITALPTPSAVKSTSHPRTVKSSFYKIMITTCSPKQPMNTLPCVICFPVPSLLVITYEVLDMACRSVLSDLNSIERHLLIEFYLVSVTDIFVCAYCLVAFRYRFFCVFIVLFRFSFYCTCILKSHNCHITRLSWCFLHIINK